MNKRVAHLKILEKIFNIIIVLKEIFLIPKNNDIYYF